MLGLCRQITNTQEVSERCNTSNWARDQSCDILAKNMADFCSCPKNLPEVKLKSIIFISLAEEISRKPNIDSVI